MPSATSRQQRHLLKRYCLFERSQLFEILPIHKNLLTGAMSADRAPGRISSLKIVLLGQTRVGKSCILDRHLHDSFEDQTPNTIGTAFATTLVETSDGVFRLQIWDTAGQEQYISLASLYYRNADIALLVFDLTHRESFLCLERWATEVRERAPARTELVLIGNKCDLEDERAVRFEEISKFRERIGAAEYFETSAKTGNGIDRLFHSIPKLRAPGRDSATAGPIPIAERTGKKQGCCG
jgi:small GTP-binding protein